MVICRGLALNRSCGQKVLSSVWRPSGRFVLWLAMKCGRRLLCISFCTGTKVRVQPTDWRAAKGNTGSSGSEKASVFTTIRRKKSIHHPYIIQIKLFGMDHTCYSDGERHHYIVNSIYEEVCPFPRQFWWQLLQNIGWRCREELVQIHN